MHAHYGQTPDFILTQPGVGPAHRHRLMQGKRIMDLSQHVLRSQVQAGPDQFQPDRIVDHPGIDAAAKNGWTQERASKEFGISMRTYIRYEQADPQRPIELAIQALSLAAMLPDIDALPADTLRQRVRTLAVDIQSG